MSRSTNPLRTDVHDDALRPDRGDDAPRPRPTGGSEVWVPPSQRRLSEAPPTRPAPTDLGGHRVVDRGALRREGLAMLAELSLED